MSSLLNKLILISVTLLLGVMSIGVKAQTNYDFNGTTYTLNTYDGTWSQFQSAKPSYSNVLVTPWWGSEDIAKTFALGISANLGFIDNSGLNSDGPMFVFSDSPLTTANYDPGDPGAPFPYTVPASVYHAFGWDERLNFNWVYVSSSSPSGVVPEMNASLIPQVGLLLGCLFFLMGRRNEVVEPMLAA